MNHASIVLAISSAFACSAGAGEPVNFTAEPMIRGEKDGVKIEFAVSRSTDVAVEVMNEKGETVRHLAAGVLGDPSTAPTSSGQTGSGQGNAPEPLKPGLAQSLLWDRRDDLGRNVPAGNYSVRVGLELSPHLKKLQNFDALAMGTLYGVGSMPNGGIVLAGAPRYGITRYMVVDRDGKGMKQLYPPPANMKPEDSPGLPFFQRGDGRWVPLLDQGLPNVTTHTAMTAAGDNLVLCPDNGGAPRVIDLKTGGLREPLTDPLFGWGKGRVCIRGAAASPDGRFLYVTGIEGGSYGAFALLHAIHRLPMDGSGPAAVFFGDPAASNRTDTTLNKPVGLATDKDGNVYVCDNGNDRIMVIGPDGRFRRAMESPSPIFIQVHPGSGDIFVLGGQGVIGSAKGGGDSRALGWRGHGLKVSKLSADGKTIASAVVPKPLDCASYTGLALDAGREPAVLWFSSRGWAGASKLERYQDNGTNLLAMAPVQTGPRKGFGASPSGYDPRYVNNTPAYPPYSDAVNYSYFPDEGTPFYSMSPDARNLWADGNMYTRKNWALPGGLQRLHADKTPFPFEAIGTNVLEVDQKVSSPWHPNRGMLVDRRGHIYLRYTYLNDQKLAIGGKDGAMTTGIAHYGADGQKLGMTHLSNSTYGMGVDARGNLYVGDKPRPAGVMVPADIEKAFNGKVPQNIIDSYGCVMKFGPVGGTYVWSKGRPAGNTPREKRDLWKTPPPGLDAFDNYGRPYTADVKGAQWMWLGMSLIPTYYTCICSATEMAVDPHGRVFVPDRVACRVAVLDSSGNLIRYIGAYGNVDSRGKDSPVPDPEIAFALLRMVIPSCTSRQIRVADSGNNWVSVISLDYAKEARVPVAVP